ncbi:20117_t:CDS:10 [Cetraspora pellucida]|uniref:20117_t:CDS:1 n=1 Tax=Cetraspora pellucida TaxID=1433469 RepID=A0A9N8W5A5_9GLOM|nr:20117_t:CDS:10 [Cetraspora pellucida]
MKTKINNDKSPKNEMPSSIVETVSQEELNEALKVLLNTPYQKRKKLTQLLKKDERLIIDGNLAKNKIIELALKFDKELLKLLLSSPEIKKIFFQEVDDILVFDKIKFQSFVSNKQFLPDILTNFQKYEAGKEVPINDILPNDNLIIKGNNLLSLYSLKEKYQSKIKLIYIDPPYNPDSKSNTFVYNNVAIDEKELAKLKILLEEIFRGYEIHCITIVHMPQGTQSVNFAYIHEYAIFVIPEGKKNLRRGDNLRSDAKNCFYPIIVENDKVIGFGEVLSDDEHPKGSVVEKDGKFWIYPIDSNNIERKWNYARQNVEEVKKFLRARKTRNGCYEIEIGKDFETYRTQDGGNRKFIICEQMDYIETVTKERIRKVCEIDNKGSFVYCELAEFNQGFINQIQEAKNTVELWKIWEQMKKIAFLSYKIEPKDIDNTKKEFEELSFEEQQKFLISLLDKNLLYVPYCDIEDESYEMSEENFEGKSNQPQLLFLMATGSGKTLMMAGLILYLYQQGYRNFLFFVNSTNIIDKTRDNFLNDTSIKYLFNKSISFEDKKIILQEVDNFQTTDNDNINICFETIQGLHSRLNTPRENNLTYEDFQDQKIVLISDEAHHINVETKSGSKPSKEEKEEIKKYAPRLIFDYPLKEFRRDGYSKDVRVLQTDAEPFERALQAVLLSQYRRKIFEKNGKIIKPVILFKSKTIKESEEFQERFVRGIAALTSDKLKEIEINSKDESLTKAFKYFATNKISLDNLVAELQEDFSAEKTLSINSQNESEKNQLAVNTLEAPNNEYRAIFAVDKLNEGWDVLNLFDIVRLYDTRDAKNNIPGPTTIKEAQLIGRGARYCPFKINETHDPSQRKFDRDLQNEMRICEELYYHSNYNPRYIQELTSALIKTGIIPDNTIKIKLAIKKEFKNTEFYQSGLLFLNQPEKYSRNDVWELPSAILNFPYQVSLRTNISLSRDLFFERVKITVSGLKSQLQELKPEDEIKILTKTIGQITSSLASNSPVFRGSKEFKHILLKEKIDDKELNFAPNENCFGTSEEKYFVKYIDRIYDKLQEKYDQIYLVRNERFFKLYNFEDGKPFEPDYVLFLRQKKPSKKLYYQVFIEPKGTYLKEKDI